MRLFQSIILLALSTLATCRIEEESALSTIQHPMDMMSSEKHHVPGNSTLQYCDGNQSYDILKIHSLNYTFESDLPSPPPPPSSMLDEDKKGLKVTVSLSAELTETIEKGATVELLVTIARFILYSDTIDLCEKKDSDESKCPIEKGLITVNKEMKVPKSWLKKFITVKANLFNYNNKRITCVYSYPHHSW